MLPDFAQTLHERFAREGIPLLLAGGWAVCHHGYSRFTNDVDWVCSRSHESGAMEIMESLGFEIVFEAMATRFKHRKHLDLVPVDLLWVNADTFARMETTTQMTGRHHDIPVIDFETLLAMKLHALKDQVERRNKDLLDIFELLHENEGVLTEEELRKICERFGGPDAYNIVRRIS